MIKKDQQKQIDELVKKMKSEVTDDYSIIHVLQGYAEYALNATWLETENIILAAYQLGKESKKVVK